MIDVFKRYETKYLISFKELKMIKKVLEEHNIKIDEYGKTSIQSLYYDTPYDLLVRRSIEKPEYKEKLRLRSYGRTSKNSCVFLEIKKKSQGIVYKRRIKTTTSEASNFIKGELDYKSQIGHELNYFRNEYDGLKPKCLIMYEREAYLDSSSDLRITFDYDIRYRVTDLDMSRPLDGKKIIKDGYVLMEIKTGYAYPLWLCRVLNDNKIFKNSFSKYGEAYIDLNKGYIGGNLKWQSYLNPSLVMAM